MRQKDLQTQILSHVHPGGSSLDIISLKPVCISKWTQKAVDTSAAHRSVTTFVWIGRHVPHICTIHPSINIWLSICTAIKHKQTHSHSHSHIQFRASNWPDLHIFRLWEETGAPGRNNLSWVLMKADSQLRIDTILSALLLFCQQTFSSLNAV